MTQTQVGADPELIFRASKVIASTPDYDELLTRIIEITTEAVRAETGSLLLYDEHAGALVFEVALGEKGGSVRGRQIRPGEGIIGRVFSRCEPAVVNDVRVEPDAPPTPFETRSVLCVPLVLRGKTVGVIQAVNKVDRGNFDEADVRTMRWLADLTAIAIENSRLYHKARQEQREKESLLDVAKRINAVLELEQVLDMIADSMHEVMPYDALAIYLVDQRDQKLKHLIHRGFESEQESTLPLKLGEGIVGWCTRNCDSAVVPDVTKDTRYYNARAQTRSEIVAPLLIGGRCLGAINLESDRLAAWDLHQLDLLKAYAAQVSVAIERAMLHRELMEKKELEQELTVAHRIQRTFLPRSRPEIPGYDIAGKNIPSEQVGGDYFDFISIVDNQLGIVISDVSGKGIPAALIMASFRASLWAEIRNNYAIHTILAKVGRLLRESIEPHHFVTAIYGVLDIANRLFTYANAGHNPPILVRADRAVRFLKEGGLPLCVMVQPSYAEKRLQLRAGDLLVFYTDGVTEAFNPQGDEFGVGRLIDALQKAYDLPAPQIIDRIIADVDAFGGSPSHSDDLTLVVVKVL